MAEQAPVPRSLSGMWRREWIRANGATKNEVAVWYLQTSRAFADLRIRRDRPPIAARSFDEATDRELRALADQKGFAGFTTFADGVATWRHELDFQPTAADEVDVGSIEPHGTAMLESALDGAYTELWWPASSGDGKHLAIERRVDGRLDRLFVVAGDFFMWVRNRAVELPSASSIGALIDSGAASRETIVAWLDCEISVGQARGGVRDWQITRSTLPWREGEPFHPPCSHVDGSLVAETASTILEQTLGAEDLTILFPATAR